MNKIKITSKETTVSKLIDASRWEIFLYLITNGRKGRLYRMVEYPAKIWQTPSHINCRCATTMSPERFKREYFGDFKSENPNEWTHKTKSGYRCKIVVPEPDVNGIIIVINERGEYMRHFAGSLKVNPSESEIQEFASALTRHPNDLDNIAEIYAICRKPNESCEELKKRINAAIKGVNK